MVHVYNCHPFASQRIVPTEQEPGLVCCGGGALFVVSAGGCKIEAYQIQEEECPLICRFSTMGVVHSIVHSQVGDYLITIEEKNNATYLRAYTNWRYQATEKTRVGVRLLGHFLRGSSLCGIPKEQMEIIEIPLFQSPLCVACCTLTGDLLVGCARSLVVFSLKRQSLSERLAVLDFERVLVLHIPNWTPLQVAFCAGYVALQTELEVLVVKLEHLENVPASEEHALHHRMVLSDMKKEPLSHNEPDDFFVFPKHLEILGEEAKDCGVSVTLEWMQMETEAKHNMGVTYVLYRRFVPDFFQGCLLEEACLHSLQLHPMCIGDQDGSRDNEPLCVFCFFSLPSTGYMYSLKNTVELISTYQYPELTFQAVLCDEFLYVITRSALQCYTVRCSAVAVRAKDPYIDTTLKACPPFTMEVCALRIQLFIGLKSLCHDGKHIVVLTAADVESKVETERAARKLINRKSSLSKLKETKESAHGWNLYVIRSVSTLQLYREMVEYSKQYEQTNLLSQNCVHLLSEAHLLIRAALLTMRGDMSADKAQLQEAFQESCANLGDCFSRLDKQDFHLALPYYKMSGLNVAEVIHRNIAMCRSTTADFGKGLLFFLKNSLYGESKEELSEETASMVLSVFRRTEPNQLPHVVSSSLMVKASPASVLAHLEQLEDHNNLSVTLALCKATQALRLGDMKYYQYQMGRHAEMQQVYGFIDEPQLLIYGRGNAVMPTELAQHMHDIQDGLLVAAIVALHENNKVNLEEADLFFQVLSKDTLKTQSNPQFLVDFWEALLVASAQEAIIHELLFRLTSVYIDCITSGDCITSRNCSSIKALKSADDLMNSSSHYGMLFPWLSILTPAPFNMCSHQEDLRKLQSLLCGPTLDAFSVMPLLERLPNRDNTELSVHILCATKLGQHESSIKQLLDRCPQAIIPYARHVLQDDKLALWWKELLPELCERTRISSADNSIIIVALKEILTVIAMELDPLEFLALLPDDGAAHFFLPHLLECSQRNTFT